MTRTVLLLALLCLAGCREDVAAGPEPVALTAEAVGYYCQMELLEHEGPKGQIHLDGMPAPIFFSQVRDAIAYLQMPEQNYAVSATYVQDMAGVSNWAEPGGWIAAEDAFYVIGSDRVGGMGAPEFVPFSDESAALDFARLRGGTVRHFDRIEAAYVLAPSPPKRAEESDIGTRLRALSQAPGVN